MKNLQSGYRRILLYIFCRNGSSVPPGGPRPAVFLPGDDILHQGNFLWKLRTSYCFVIHQFSTKCEAGMR